MNRWISNLIEDWEKFFRVLCLIIGVVCAGLELIINNNPLISFFALLVLTLFNLCEEVCTDAYLEKILNFLMGVNKKFVFGGLYIIALLPMVIGYRIGEITFIGIEGFIEKIFSNPLQNCLGSTIICSIINHLSKLDTQETICSVVREKKGFFDIILKFSFMASFINAINYKIDDNLPITNRFNSFHLFIVVFLGIVLLTIFFLRLIDKTPINLTTTQAYPSWVLLFGGAFLTSCGLPPLIWGNTKNEVILLTGNTLLALFVIWFLFIKVNRRCIVREKVYPYFAPALFSISVFIMLIINILYGGQDSNKLMQLISVAVIYVCVTGLLIYINKKFTKLENSDSDTN